MAKTLILGPILAKTWAPKFFSWFLSVLDVRHCCKLSLYAISRKTNDPKLRKWRKTHFEHDLGSLGPNLCTKNFSWFFLPLLNVRHCCKLSLYAIARKTKNPNSIIKWQKTSFWAWFGTLGREFFLSEIWLYQSLDIMVSYHHV